MDEGQLLFMENTDYPLVDALPYIDTQLGQSEVAQQVKMLIEEEMRHFDPRDYLESLPAPELPHLASETLMKEFQRIETGQKLDSVNLAQYKADPPQGVSANDHGAWRKAAENIHMQLEYNRLRLTNLELLERWGAKAWVAHSSVVRSAERLLANDAAKLRAAREDVNKKRKLDQISCGNELRKLGRELEQYMQDNSEVETAVQQLEAEVQRLRSACADRGVVVNEDGSRVRQSEANQTDDEKAVGTETMDKKSEATQKAAIEKVGKESEATGEDAENDTGGQKKRNAEEDAANDTSGKKKRIEQNEEKGAEES